MSLDDVTKAIKACLSSGGRQGSPAVVAAEKFMADMDKAAAEGKPMPKAKAKKDNVGGAKPGWANQGEGRSIAKTHDNSV